MESKYYNDAIIGNRRVTASFSKRGELIRLYYPTVDYRQFLEFYHTGVKINDSAIIYTHDDVNNMYKQKYVKDTNILQTEILNTYFNLRIVQSDFAPMNEDFLVRSFKFVNESPIEMNVVFLVHSKSLTNVNNETCGLVRNDVLHQYNHDYTISTFAKEKLTSYQVCGVSENIYQGKIGGKDYVGLTPDSAISYEIGLIKPGEEKTLNICIHLNDNSEKSITNELETEIERIRKIDLKKSFDDTKKYWKKYLKDHSKVEFDSKEPENKLRNIYERSILLLDLLVNKETGGISAGIEVDENKTKCGRYSYCWLRDAVYITKAMDLIGMTKDTEKFYKEFCKKTQSKNGMWEQRFYTDGRLAPGWGYQIDETASVIFGAYEHFEITKDKKFLKDVLKICENAIVFLEKYVDNMMNNEDKFKMSYDLWEETEAYSAYSIAAIFGAYDAMIKIYAEVKEFFANNRLKLEQINKKVKSLEKGLVEIKKYILDNFYDENTKAFIRNTKDRRIDISLLGLCEPFNVVTPKEKKMLNTMEKIDMTLRTYTGGYVRYENDTYMGGYNPWPIATLWMALYKLRIGDTKSAVECLNFVANTATELDLLGEQIDNQTKKPMWVIGLAWSHAMYILTIDELKKKGLI